MNRKQLYNLVIITLLILSSFSFVSALTINPPTVPRDFTSAGTYYHSSGNNAYFAVDHVMTFSQVVVDSTYVEFNDTKFNISSPNRINISLNYIKPVMNGTTGTVIIGFYANTTTGNARFNISGLTSGIGYKIYKNNATFKNATANSTGWIYFTNSVWSTPYFSILLNSSYGILPTVTTNASTGVEETNATLNGYLDDEGTISILYENYTTGDNSAHQSYGTVWNAQTFTPTTTHTINLIRLLLYRESSPLPGTITILISGTNGSGKPSGSALTTGTTNGDTLPTSTPYEWRTIIVTPITLTAGIKYAIILKSDLPGDDILYWRVDNTASTYSGGSVWAGLSGTSWTEYPTTDAMFEEYFAPVYLSSVFFEYGTTISYGTNTSYQIKNTGQTFSQNIVGLLLGQIYHYRAVATNSNGTSYGSDMTLLTKPNAPTGLSATALNNTTISLTWVKGTGANNTMIRQKTGGYPTSVIDGSLVYNSTGTTTSNSSLAPGTLYYFRAWSYTQYGTSHKWSDSYSSASQLTKPSPPTGLNINIAGYTSATLAWTKGTGANRTVIVYKTTGFPTSTTDGSLVYNNTGTSYVAPVINGTAYYFSGFSYTTWGTFSAFSIPANFTNITGGGFTINCYDELTGVNITFKVLITNADATETYSKDGCTNPETINSTLCPQGLDTIIITASGYQPRLYTTYVRSGLIYVLNAYLLPVTPPGTPSGNETSALYYLRVVESIETGYTTVDQAVEDALVTIKRYINSTGVYDTISSLLTDANGYVNLYLAPNTYYKVFITKIGYYDKISDYIPAPPNEWGQTAEKTFRIVLINITINVTHPYYEPDIIHFTGIRLGTTLYVNYTDDLTNTTNTTVFIYEIGPDGLETLLFTISNTSEDTLRLVIPGINSSRSYKAIICYTQTNFGTHYRIVTMAGERPIDTMAETDKPGYKLNMFLTVLIGYNPFGWLNFLMFLFLMMAFYYMDERFAGIIMIFVGGIFLMLNIIFGFSSSLFTVAGGALPVFFIVVGVMYEWMKSKKKTVG